VHPSKPCSGVGRRQSPRTQAGLPAALIASLSGLIALACSAGVSAQWAPVPDANAPRDAGGNVIMDAPTPRTADGKPDLSGLWMRTRSGPPPENGPGWLVSLDSATVTVRVPKVSANARRLTPSPLMSTPVRSLNSTRAASSGSI